MFTKNKKNMNEKTGVSVVTISNDEWNEVRTAVFKTSEMLSALIDNQGEYLTPSEVCKLLKIGRATYERYIGNSVKTKGNPLLKTHALAGTKRKYVKKSDVLQLLASEKCQ